MLIILFIVTWVIVAFIWYTPDRFITIKVIEHEDYNHIYVLNIFGVIMKSYLHLDYEDYDDIRDMLFKTMPRAKVIYA